MCSQTIGFGFTKFSQTMVVDIRGYDSVSQSVGFFLSKSFYFCIAPQLTICSQSFFFLRSYE